MVDAERLLQSLDNFGLGRATDALAPILRERLGPRAHGDIGKWREALEQLPERRGITHLDEAAIRVAAEATSSPVNEGERAGLVAAFKAFCPWRKGPFDIHGIRIETEWRSDLKWERIESAIEPLSGRRVLDVGCGNGYFALRMRGAGAERVLGIDPSLLFLFQFAAIQHFAGADRIAILPLRLEELPQPAPRFDTTFSMGVLYHRRDPLLHLRELHATLRPGGQLVLETLVLPGDDAQVLVPEGRYARMRNVWHLPTVPALQDWLTQCGYRDRRLIDVTRTTTNEQRTTDWMPYESLAEALDPVDRSLTVEGLPAPTRAVVVCTA